MDKSQEITIYRGGDALRVVRGEHAKHEGASKARVTVYPTAVIAYAMEKTDDVRAALLRIDPNVASTRVKVGAVRRTPILCSIRNETQPARAAQEESSRHRDMLQAPRRASSRRGTEVFSIFGQCEAAAADHLIAKYGLHRIEFADIPESARYNDANRPARFAVIVPRERVAEFNQLCASLRA